MCKLLRIPEPSQPSQCWLLLLSLLFVWNFRDVKELLQGHRVSKQQLMHSVPSLVFPTMNVPNSSQHRSAHHGVTSVFRLTMEMGRG